MPLRAGQPVCGFFATRRGTRAGTGVLLDGLRYTVGSSPVKDGSKFTPWFFWLSTVQRFAISFQSRFHVVKLPAIPHHAVVYRSLSFCHDFCDDYIPGADLCVIPAATAKLCWLDRGLCMEKVVTNAMPRSSWNRASIGDGHSRHFGSTTAGNPRWICVVSAVATICLVIALRGNASAFNPRSIRDCRYVCKAIVVRTPYVAFDVRSFCVSQFLRHNTRPAPTDLRLICVSWLITSFLPVLPSGQPCLAARNIGPIYLTEFRRVEHKEASCPCH